MPVIGDRGAIGASIVEPFPLEAAVADLYGEPLVDPLLQRLLGHSQGLLGTVAGSISLVDRDQGRYDKRAEIGIPCRVGQSFPLDEGATGQAVARRMPAASRTTRCQNHHEWSQSRRMSQAE